MIFVTKTEESFYNLINKKSFDIKKIIEEKSIKFQMKLKKLKLTNILI